jgi:hypothetical protein
VAGAGLLFLSLQQSMAHFAGLLARSVLQLDPLLASSAQWQSGAFTSASPNGCGATQAQKWAIGDKEICFPLVDLTTVLGGEYFYIPSLPFIRGLA